MHLELLAMITDGLQNGSVGINAMIPTVPRDGGHAAPPNIATFLSEGTNAEASRGRHPEPSDTIVYPIVNVVLLEDPEITGEVYTTFQDAKCRLLAIVAVDQKDSVLGTQQVRYLGRALRKSINRILIDDTLRVRNQIEIISVTSLREMRAGKNENDTKITTGLEIACDVRDNQP